MNSPFHFPSLVWDYSIAIYLFLLGISAGATMLAVLLKRNNISERAEENNIIKVSALLAPITLIIGLVILIFHLAKPWTFWYLMFNYQSSSIMSMGVILFQVYMLFLILWLMTIFKQLVENFVAKFIPKLTKIVNKTISILEKFTNIIEIITLVLCVLLGAYTGFLLSALISYPMLNNPILPILFLASGTSSGIAALIVCALLFTKEQANSKSVAFLHKFESPIMYCEIFLLAAFFIGLYLAGGQKVVAFETAILGGFWSDVFWFCIVGAGLIVPLLLNMFASHNIKHKKGFILLVSCLGLFGVLCLRFFILYAGQMTLA